MIQTAILRVLTEQLGEDLVAAFVYGSVAAGRASSSSDVDCFVLTRAPLPAELRHRLNVEFSSLQRDLGYTPDPDYPIEVFDAATCESLLTGPELARVLALAATGQFDLRDSASDEVEVLRALLDTRLTLRPSPVLDHLTDRARVAFAQAGGTPGTLGPGDAVLP